jgi:hypothetical protein
MGLIVALIGGYECKEGVDTYRTGIPAYTLRHHAMAWQDSLGVGVVTIAFGLLVVAVGFGWVKPRGAVPRGPSK